jgi:hypothetical protein
LNTLEQLVADAWSSAFQQTTPQGPNPNYIPGILDQPANSTLKDVPSTTDDSGKVDICTVVADPYTPIPDGHASLACTGMTLAGFSAAVAAPPTCADNDATVVLPMTIAALTVNGSYTIHQTCSDSYGISTFPATPVSGAFKLVVDTVTLTLNCSIAPTPAITLNSVTMSFGKAAATTSTTDMNWLAALLGHLTALASALEQQVQTLLSSSQLTGQMNAALEGVLKAAGPE